MNFQCIQKFLYLSLLILASCSFQKNPKSEIEKAQNNTIQSQKVPAFCDSHSTMTNLPIASLLALSTSDQETDLCVVWNQIKSYKKNDFEDDHLDVVNNFSESALKYIYTSGKPVGYFNQFARDLTNLILSSNGKSIEYAITINNRTKNSNNNLTLIPFLKDNMDLLFSSTNDLSSNEFSDYWESIENVYSKDAMCDGLLINKILTHKTITSHLLSISRSCRYNLTSKQIIEARINLNTPVSENEVRYFHNAIKSGSIVTLENEKLSSRRVIITAISREDENLFKLTTGIPSDESTIYIFTLSYVTQGKIESLIERLNSDDLAGTFDWNDIKEALDKKGFKEVLNLYYKHNIFPKENATLDIVQGLKDQRKEHPEFYTNSSIIDLFRYLRSNPPAGFNKSLESSKFTEQELDLIYKGKTDPSVLEFIAKKKIEDISVAIQESLLSFYKLSFSIEHLPGTYRIDGVTFVTLGSKTGLDSLSAKNFLYFVKEDGWQGFSVTTEDVLAAIKNKNFDNIALNCKGKDCEELVSIYQVGTRSLIKRIYESYISPKDE